jgi:hypothetical protein
VATTASPAAPLELGFVLHEMASAPKTALLEAAGRAQAGREYAEAVALYREGLEDGLQVDERGRAATPCCHVLFLKGCYM